MNNCIKVCALFVVSAALLIGSCLQQEKPVLQKPSDISSVIFDSVLAYVHRGEISSQEQFNATRDRFARMYVDSMLTHGLDREEQYKRANILFWSGDRKHAKSLLRELMQVEDELTRKVTVELVTMEIEDGVWDSAESLMKEFRSKYQPDPGASVDLYMCVDDLAGRYNNSDRPKDAIRIYLEEIEYLPFDYTYSSYYLIEELLPLMIETGRTDELRELAMTCKKNFAESLEKHLAAAAPEDSTAEDYEKLTRSFNVELEHLQSILARLDLLGTKAPPLSGIHVFNADSSFTMDRSAGKVTIMDFWTTWCVACIIGYVELDEIYSDYDESDLAVLGITSLQGNYFDVVSREREGSEEEPLSEEREIELTAEYIEKRKISWPCLISDKPVTETGYYINGFPTYVILDRNGVIRYMHMGVGKQRQVRRIIEKLLAES